jgi:hypothetical protein
MSEAKAMSQPFSKPPPGDDVAATIVPYKNPTALFSYYCGVFSLIPCAALGLAPMAIVLGILGLRAQRRNPLAHGTAHAVVGLVLGTITLLLNVGALVALIVAIIHDHDR